ncbi:MAG: hypothetical protein PHY30_02640 [Candidatus Pacebacteria bacterium]|nr:hypothetical protein [Candidatus Paceibacterota bacterium]
MNIFEQPKTPEQSTNEQASQEKIDKIADEASIIFRNLNAGQKVDFIRRVTGKNEDEKLIIEIPQEEKEIGGGVSMGEEVTSAYRDHLEQRNER